VNPLRSLTSAHTTDVRVPGTSYTFGVVEAAQARGDLSVLEQRGRRAIRVHFEEANAGLETLETAIEEAL
jgi:hypothetical protein